MPTEIAVLRAALRDNPAHHAKLRELAESGAIGPLTDIPDDQPFIVIAAPEHFGMEGAKQARCPCGLIVWLSPTTQRMIDERNAIPGPMIMCAWCFFRELRRNGEMLAKQTRTQ
jgi:hypothetical protein